MTNRLLDALILALLYSVAALALAGWLVVTGGLLLWAAGVWGG